mgnify:CR=1 FL=1
MDEELSRAEPAREAEAAPPPGDATTLFIEALASAVGVETAFGEPVTVGERVIIPAAETAMGGGVGIVHFPEGQRPPARVIRATSGGGGGASTRPVAAVVVTPQGVRVEPIFDLSRVVLTGIASTAGFLQGLLAFVRAVRKR